MAINPAKHIADSALFLTFNLCTKVILKKIANIIKKVITATVEDDIIRAQSWRRNTKLIKLLENGLIDLSLINKNGKVIVIEVTIYPPKKFPSLKQISSYGRAQTMTKKSSQEMKEICDAGLNKLMYTDGDL